MKTPLKLIDDFIPVYNYKMNLFSVRLTTMVRRFLLRWYK